MATFTKKVLSGSTSGRPIGVLSATAGGDTVIHVGGSASNVKDEVFLYAINKNSQDLVLSLEWGATAASDRKTILVPSFSKYALAEGDVIEGVTAASGIRITAFCSTSDSLLLTGFVNRISE